ncbi:hypothetical protein [Campylobacter fetus]|uniref:hypothetical protein n=1 Tax=Campylobacter fetus TaxID=196 RepID=UPI000FCA7394|nr:hypothetical protein [Campylobacter fetus]RUT51004.1 hypothetical protein BWK67_00325 [Campylobacter fetus]RUT51732.1 hypothetical protein BWK51_00325 [Campylobacter fetus]
MFKEFIINFTWYHIFKKLGSYNGYLNNEDYHLRYLIKPEYISYLQELPILILQRFPLYLIAFLIVSSFMVFIYNKTNNIKANKEIHKNIMLYSILISVFIGDLILALPIIITICIILYIKDQDFSSIKKYFIRILSISICSLLIFTFIKNFISSMTF